MKSAVNGGLQLSVLDGWWAEGYDGTNGWALDGDVDDDHGAQDHAHAAGAATGCSRRRSSPSSTTATTRHPAGVARARASASMKTNARSSRRRACCATTRSASTARRRGCRCTGTLVGRWNVITRQRVAVPLTGGAGRPLPAPGARPAAEHGPQGIRGDVLRLVSRWIRGRRLVGRVGRRRWHQDLRRRPRAARCGRRDHDVTCRAWRRDIRLAASRVAHNSPSGVAMSERQRDPR